MTPLYIILLALALAMDEFAVSISYGSAYCNLCFRKACKVAIIFGLFHIFMPLTGYLIGSKVVQYIAPYDHWIACGLLAVVGIKMIIEGFSTSNELADKDLFDNKTTLLVGLATSIDSLAVGFSVSLLQVSIMIFALVVGITAFGMALLGIYIGRKLRHLFENKILILGGLILIGIGIKIVYDHLKAG